MRRCLFAAGVLAASVLVCGAGRQVDGASEALRTRGNPYHAAVLDSLENLTGAPDLPEKFDSCWTFRGLAEKALNAAWAASWDASPRKGDRRLIEHAGAIIDFCLQQQKDGSWFYARRWKAGDPNCDRFTLGPIMDAICWLRRLPGMDENWKRWESPLLEHDFATVSHGRARPGYAQRSTRHSAVTLRTADDAFTAKPGEALRYAAAIAPGSPPVSGFRRADREGETGFDVRIGQQTFSVVFRPSTAAVRLTAKREE